MIKAVIFDMDGVLVDSEPLYFDEMVENCKAAGIELDLIALEKTIGMAHHDFMPFMHSIWPVEATDEEINAILYDTEPRKYPYCDVINDGAIELLNKLKQEGKKIAIASATETEKIQKILTETEMIQYFDLISSGHDCERSKPDPEIYLKTMKHLKVKPEECLIIEDSPAGIQAAINAGVKVVALKQKRFSLDQSKALLRIDSLLQVLEVIKKIENKEL